MNGIKWIRADNSVNDVVGKTAQVLLQHRSRFVVTLYPTDPFHPYHPVNSCLMSSGRGTNAAPLWSSAGDCANVARWEAQPRAWMACHVTFVKISAGAPSRASRDRAPRDPAW